MTNTQLTELGRIITQKVAGEFVARRRVLIPSLALGCSARYGDNKQDT